VSEKIALRNVYGYGREDPLSSPEICLSSFRQMSLRNARLEGFCYEAKKRGLVVVVVVVDGRGNFALTRHHSC